MAAVAVRRHDDPAGLLAGTPCSCWPPALRRLDGAARAAARRRRAPRRPTLAASRRAVPAQRRRRGRARPVAVGVGGRVVGGPPPPSRRSRRLLRLPGHPRRRAGRGADLGARPGLARGGRRTTASTGSTPRSWCPRSSPTQLAAADPRHGRPRDRRSPTSDLLDRQLTEAWVTLCCVSNPVGGDLIGNAWWSGVRIADLLAEAGVQAGADAVLQTSAGRLDLRHPARGADRRPQRDAGGGDERRAAARSSTASRCG